MSKFTHYLAAAFALAVVLFTIGSAHAADVIYVGPGATGEGTSWEDLAPVTAINTADGTKEVWLKAGEYAVDAALSSAVALTIRGGFAGTEHAASERTAGAKSVLDGGNESAHGTILTLTASSGMIVLDGLVLSNAYTRAVSKTGNGSLALYNVDILDNARNEETSLGRGLYASGSKTSSELILSNVVVSGNATTKTDANVAYSGAGLNVQDFKLFTMTDVKVMHNGLVLTMHTRCPSRDSTHGGAVYIKNAPIRAKNVAFIGNNAGSNNSYGNVMYLEGACGGSVFENCRWVGNEHCKYSNGSGSSAGALTISLSNGATLALTNCTFAFNTACDASCAGLHVKQGAVTVRNSIFAKNVVAKTKGVSADLRVSGGTLDIDYSLLTANAADYITQDATKITMGTHMIWGDPLFATDDATFLSYLANGAIPRATSDDVYFKNTDGADMRALDVHLQSGEGRYENGTWKTDSVSSWGIDNGDPASSCLLEPDPNGGLINLGCYGNTIEASKTQFLLAEFDDEVTVDVTRDWTRPYFSAALKASEKGYAATVELAYSTTRPADFGAATLDADWRGNWADIDTVTTSAGPGDSIAVHTKGYYETGTTLWWRLAVTTISGTVWKEGSVLITSQAPPTWGRGGGADVVHVWAGATGKGDGTTWLDAYTNIVSAFAAVTATRTNVWITGTVLTSPDPEVQPSVSRGVLVIGGFTAMENGVADRPQPIVRATVTGQGMTLKGCSFSVPNGQWTTIRDIDFTASIDHGLQKSGNGSLALYNVDILDNARNVTALQGRGLYASGSQTTSELILSNVVVSGNLTTATSGDNNDHGGAGLYVQNFKLFTMTDVKVMHNGLELTKHTSCPGRDKTFGGAVYVNNAPIRARNVAVIGNNAESHNTHGGVMYLTGACGGSVFENCRWVGNEHCPFSATSCSVSGALVVNLSSGDTLALTNCTFAFNVAGVAYCAGLHVMRGAVTVRNSIFAKNVVAKNAGVSADLRVSGGTLDIDYSLLTANAADYITQDATKITMGTHMTWGDPLFATDDATFLSCLVNGAIPRATSDTVYFTNTDGADMRALDVHLQSGEGRYENGTWKTDPVSSKAIDKGDPMSSCLLEPDPNGGLINLGCYGNTIEASMTQNITAEFDGEVTIDVTRDWTRPYFSAALTASEKGYAATVELAYSTTQPADFGAATLDADWRGNWADIDTVTTSAGPGDSIAVHTKGYYETGTTLWWRLAVTTVSGTVWKEGSVLITSQTPPTWGRGGGADVVHVWAGATGKGDGTTWLDAYTNIVSAFAAVTATRTNVWIAGTVLTSPDLEVQPSVSRGVLVLGGFTAMENGVADRPQPIVRATVTGQGMTLKGCSFSVPDGQWTTIRDIDFTASIDHGLQKTGVGSLALYNVDIRDNARNGQTIFGRGLYASGDHNKSELVLSNIVVSGNVSTDASESMADTYSGAGLNVQNFKLFTMTDVKVMHNGLELTKHASCPGRDGTFGGAVYVNNAPVRARNVAVIGNNAGSHNTHGNVMYLTGACGGSVFENCRWVGNEHCTYGMTEGGYCSVSGALVVNLSSGATLALTNCTFAFNVAGYAYCAGLHVMQGAVTVRNSIFAKNVVAKYAGVSADLLVSGGTLDIDYSMLATNDADYITQDASKITMGTHMTWGDPLFATNDETFVSCLVNGAIPKATSDDVYFKNTDGADMRALNVHLRSLAGWTDETTGELVRSPRQSSKARYSGAIDKGDPASPCVREPKPNGRCVNLGCYGNTPWASRSPGGVSALIIR